MQQGNLFEDVPADLPEELFEAIVARDGVRLERIVSRGHATPDGQWYDQEWDEWVLLVRGSAAIVIEGRDAPAVLSPGDHLMLPAHCRHRVDWTDPRQDTVWLALHVRKE